MTEGGEPARKSQLSTEEERTVRIHLGFSGKWWRFRQVVKNLTEKVLLVGEDSSRW